MPVGDTCTAWTSTPAQGATAGQLVLATDSANQLSEIFVPGASSQQVIYYYSGSGCTWGANTPDLCAVKDVLGNTTSYTYDGPSFEYYLLTRDASRGDRLLLQPLQLGRPGDRADQPGGGDTTTFYYGTATPTPTTTSLTTTTVSVLRDRQHGAGRDRVRLRRQLADGRGPRARHRQPGDGEHDP